MPEESYTLIQLKTIEDQKRKVSMMHKCKQRLVFTQSWKCNHTLSDLGLLCIKYHRLRALPGSLFLFNPWPRDQGHRDINDKADDEYSKEFDKLPLSFWNHWLVSDVTTLQHLFSYSLENLSWLSKYRYTERQALFIIVKT